MFRAEYKIMIRLLLHAVLKRHGDAKLETLKFAIGTLMHHQAPAAGPLLSS